jgi:epsilon-lactone hydrolase
MTSSAEHQPYVNIPDTISPEAQAYLRTLRDPAFTPPFPEAHDLDSRSQGSEKSLRIARLR